MQEPQRGLGQRVPGGTVYIQSGGVFGPVYLTGGVTIVGPADRSAVIRFASGTAPGCVSSAPGNCGAATAAYALEISAASGDAFRLENLTIDNGAGPNGAIKVGNAGNVAMSRVTVLGGTGAAPQIILVAPSASGQLNVAMSQCDVGGSATGGALLVQPQSTADTRLELLDCQLHNAKFGLKLDATGIVSTLRNIQAEANDSDFYSFNGSGVATIGGTNVLVLATLHHVKVFNAGGFGIQANQINAQVLLDASKITQNATGVNVQSGGQVFTAGNNVIAGNGVDCTLNGGGVNCTPSVLTALGLK